MLRLENLRKQILVESQRDISTKFGHMLSISISGTMPKLGVRIVTISSSSLPKKN